MPGLRGADAAIAVRGTPAAATDVAHVVLMGGDLRALPGLFALVRRHADNLRRGLWINGAGTVAGVVGVRDGCADHDDGTEAQGAQGLADREHGRSV